MKNISKNLIALSFAFGIFALFGVGSAQSYYNYEVYPPVYPPMRAMSATEYMYYNGTPVPAYQPVSYKRVELTPTYSTGYYYESTTVVQPYQQVAYPNTAPANNAPVVNNYYYGSNTPSSSTKSTTSSTTKASTTTKSANTSNTSNGNSNGMVAAVQPRTIGANNNLMASAADSYNPYCYTGDYSNYSNGNNLTALSFKGSGGFMPSSIWQWILAIMLILAIVVIARMIVKSNPHRDPASTPIH